MISTDMLWVSVTGLLVSLSCAWVGSFLVLRKLSMIGDAISHSVLFGLVVAFLLAQSRAPWVMFLGAIAAGLLTAWLTDYIHRRGSLQQDAAIGVVFTTLFAAGVVLISLYADKIDLDQDCVLYGELAFVPFDTLVVGDTGIGPRAFWAILPVAILNLLFIVFGYRAMQITSFSPVLAGAIGFNAVFWHYLLMTMTSLTTVASFDAVGAILVVAMLVVPANTALLFAKSVRSVLLTASLIALIATLLGLVLATYLDSSIAASITVMLGGMFLITLIFRRTTQQSKTQLK